MKICLILERFHPDKTYAASILLTQLSRLIKDSYPDIEIHVITQLSKHLCSSRMEMSEDWDGILISRISVPNSKKTSTFLRIISGFIFSLRSLVTLVRKHCNQRYDIILLATNPPTLPIVGYVMSTFASVPYIYVIHDLFPDIAVNMGAITHDSILTRVACKFQKNWIKNAAAVVVVGNCMRTKLIEKYSISHEKLHVIRNWSDVEIIKPLSKNTSFRKIHNLNGFLVIYAGNIGKAQALGVVINAAKLIEKTYPDIIFVIVGEGSIFPEIAKMIMISGITNVHLMPPVSWNDYPDLLASADVGLVALDKPITGLAVPSKTYNIMAAGIPMIAIVDCSSDIAKMLRRHKFGIQTDPNNEFELVNAVVRMFNSPKLRQSMGLRARRECIKRYSLQQAIKQYYRLFVNVHAQITGAKENGLGNRR